MPRIKIRNAALAEAAQQHVELMEEKYADKMRFSETWIRCRRQSCMKEKERLRCSILRIM